MLSGLECPYKYIFLHNPEQMKLPVVYAQRIQITTAVTIQWTGLLDRSTAGLTKTEMNRNIPEIRQRHTGKTWSFTVLASLTGLLRSAQ